MGANNGDIYWKENVLFAIITFPIQVVEIAWDIWAVFPVCGILIGGSDCQLLFLA